VDRVKEVSLDVHRFEQKPCHYQGMALSGLSTNPVALGWKWFPFRRNYPRFVSYPLQLLLLSGNFRWLLFPLRSLKILDLEIFRVPEEVDPPCISPTGWRKFFLSLGKLVTDIFNMFWIDRSEKGGEMADLVFQNSSYAKTF
jgi:hypothetical protein